MRRIKKKIFQARAVVALIILVSGVGLSTLARMTWRPLPAAADAGNGGDAEEDDLRLLAPDSCTIFTAAYGGTALFGNNEDTMNPKTYYWVVPAGAGNYGGIYF